MQLAALGGAAVTQLRRDEEIVGQYDLVVDAVGGATFGAAIEHVAREGLVVNLATGAPDEVVSFRAARFDRAAGARIYTLNLFDELPRINAANGLARLLRLLEARMLTAPVELQVPWQEIHVAIDDLLSRAISGKAVLQITS